jgi:ABC-type branched-subunit amino acid transport system ATPase component
MLSMFSFGASNSTAPPIIGLLWLAMAVVFGVRRPGGALLAGFAVAAGAAVLHGLGDVLPGAVARELVGSAFFLPILSGLGAISLAQEPDGILALAGLRSRRRKLSKQRQALVASAEGEAHGGVVPEHEQLHKAGHKARPADESAAMSLRGIVAGYDGVEILHGVDLDLYAGKVVALLGANGAGKSTLCAVVSGLISPDTGSVMIQGGDITGWPAFQRARRGLLLVPEARGVFPGLSVEENLAVVLRTSGERERAYDRFSVLSDRRRQLAGQLSGGEQQMLSLAPALVKPPAVLLADEPTLGLSPLVAEEVMRAIVEVCNQGTAVLLVEEHAQNAFAVADTVAFMELGSLTWIGPREDLDVEELSAVYLGRKTSKSNPPTERLTAVSVTSQVDRGPIP